MSVFVLLFLFFFNQKTAYEMRISDWSSDVCSSDLPGGPAQSRRGDEPAGGAVDLARHRCRRRPADGGADRVAVRHRDDLRTARPGDAGHAGVGLPAAAPAAGCGRRDVSVSAERQGRSEEHTSDLQSLMRISYAVFSVNEQIEKNGRQTVRNP